MEGLAEGEVLAERYRIGPVAGHGAVGEVHLAEDLRLARPVAIKSLRPELARYPEVRHRFGQEAKAAARISHPNVVRVFDSGEQDGIPYLVMECLPGTTLVDELAWGPLEPRRARRVALDVLGALDAAHRLGVVHRDVKPGNILLTDAADGPVKVSDFGIAKSADDHSLTDSGSLVGTPAYLAPERVAGEAAGPPSDLYSVGVVLYEAMAGRKPYEGETALALALAIHMGDGPNLGDLRPDLDPVLLAVVDKALARDPAQRFASAAEMSDALRAWRPRAVRPGPAGGAIASEAAAALATTAAPTVGLFPGATAAGPLIGADGRRSVPVRARLRSRAGILALGAAGLVLVVLVVGTATRRDTGRAAPLPAPTSIDPLAGAGSTTTSSQTGATSSSVNPSTHSSSRPSTPVTTVTTVAAPPTTRAVTTTTVLVTTTRRPTTTATTTPTTTAPPTTPPTVPA